MSDDIPYEYRRATIGVDMRKRSGYLIRMKTVVIKVVLLSIVTVASLWFFISLTMPPSASEIAAHNRVGECCIRMDRNRVHCLEWHRPGPSVICEGYVP